MKIVTELKEWQTIRASLNHRSIGFVPTMGNLHAGHLSLCKAAQSENEITVVSIFINPLQFNQESDFTNYPRTLAADKMLLDKMQIDYLLYPKEHELYSDHYTLQIVENELSCELEGLHRPSHFNGMLTVVLKLLNLIAPSTAYFGEKDYQQFLLIQKMVAALFLATRIKSLPTVRAIDGLALSSRNARLSATERELARAFPRYLSSDLQDAAVAATLIRLGIKVDYIASAWGRRLGAVWVGETRLIDNFVINHKL